MWPSIRKLIFIVKISCIIGIITGNLWANEMEAKLVFDEDFEYTNQAKEKFSLPRNYRTAFGYPNNLLQNKSQAKHTLKNADGLDKLKISASGQFSEVTLQHTVNKINSYFKKDEEPIIWILDLRRESHGFLNGYSISWFADGNKTNRGLTSELIMQKEAEQLNSLLEYNDKNPLYIEKIIKKDKGIILETVKHLVKVKDIATEKELANKLKLNYLRLPVADHQHPQITEVDKFVKFVRSNQEKNIWLHAHCRAGKGRSTTFMALYDILQNVKTVELEDIIARQAYIGGRDLFNIPLEGEISKERHAVYKQRKEFIEKFYQYAKDPNGFPKTLWSEWLMLKNLKN